MEKPTTPAENRKLKELFLAIYFNDLEKVIDFKNREPKIYAKKNNFRIRGNTTFDLVNLTIFNQIIWSDTSWLHKIMPLVERQRERTNQMLEFWHAELDQNEIYRNIEYNYYRDFFFCDDPDDYDEIIMTPISSYLNKGFREIDLRLYNRVQCFDFVEVKKLLEQDAKTNVDFDENDTAFSRISTESAFLTGYVIGEFEVFEEDGYKQDFDIIDMFSNILGLAAHEDMYHLLAQYGKDK